MTGKIPPSVRTESPELSIVLPTCLEPRSLVLVSCTRARRTSYHLVEQAERMAFVNRRTPLNIATLSQMLAVSERGLRQAFQKVYGMPPQRRLRALALSRARRALMSARGKSVNVTEIATRLGFFQLGRFSVEYRNMFGEKPSETLRQAIRERERKSTSNDRQPLRQTASEPDQHTD
jgi:AraC-like DNA-binding protein